MDSSPHDPASRSPRRGLRGDRPTMLGVLGSRPFKKLPRMGELPLPGQVELGGHPRRLPPPVIIHEVSPEVIHVLPQVFKETVQRLTGRSSNPSFRVHDEKARSLEVPDVTRAETRSSTFRIAPSLGFSIEPATVNMLIPSSGANQEFNFDDMYLEFYGDNPTTYDTGTPSQALDEFFRF